MQKFLSKNGYWVGSGLAIVTAFLLVWLSFGVGIIGKDGDPANRMYLGVIAVGIIGAMVSRFRAAGMAMSLAAAAVVQVVIMAIALILKLGLPWSGPLEILLLNVFFVGMFLLSAWLFRCATFSGRNSISTQG